MYYLIIIMKIGVCIPCHYGHIGYLDCVLASIERQTVKPDVVSISISDFKGQPLSYKSDKYEIIITTTTEEKNAAENRNIAAEAIISKVDILCFFDADDYMHPLRIEIIKKIFSNFDLDILLHNYFEYTTEFQKKHINDILPLMNTHTMSKIILRNDFKTELNNYLPFGRIFIDDNIYRFHNAHISIKTSKFIEQKFPTSEILFGCGEDSHFNYLHFIKGTKIYTTPLQLSLYAINTENQESEVMKALKQLNVVPQPASSSLS